VTNAERSRHGTGERARIEQAVALAARRARAAYHPQARWTDRVRAALQALLELADEEPELLHTVGRGSVCVTP
jgi:hypothetical protein